MGLDAATTQWQVHSEGSDGVPSRRVGPGPSMSSLGSGDDRPRYPLAPFPVAPGLHFGRCFLGSLKAQGDPLPLPPGWSMRASPVAGPPGWPG